LRDWKLRFEANAIRRGARQALSFFWVDFGHRHERRIGQRHNPHRRDDYSEQTQVCS
jgi:hypothetical protein